MGECYGTMYYLEHNKDRMKRTVAAMCIDSPAGFQNLAGTQYTWILNPHSAKSYVDALVLRLAEEYYPSVGRPWDSMEHRSSTDNYLSDPTIGIPTVMPHGGYGVHAHHNSYDTPETVDAKSLRDLMVMNAAYTYFIASAGPAEKRWMAELALTRGYNQISAATEKILDQIPTESDGDGLGLLLYLGHERLAYTLDRESQAILSAWNLRDGLTQLTAFAKQQKTRIDMAIAQRATEVGAASIQPIVPTRSAEAEKIIVRRKRLGTITLDDLPPDTREGYPAASFWGVPVSALYWCDGKRNLAEVYFKFLEKHGYVEFVAGK